MSDGYDVLGLGSVAVDDLLYVPHYPPADAKLQVRRRERQCGGLTATALVAAARLGARCAYAGVLGEDEDWLYELSIDMFPEDGCLHVYGVGEDGVTAFAEYGIKCLKQIIADEKADARAPPSIQSSPVVRVSQPST